MKKLFFAAIGVLVGTSLVTADNKPNILLIFTDDHAQWAVGAYGNNEVHTPHIDRLAADGMRFTRGFTKPVCSPSRAMLLTGKYSHRLGIPDYIPYGNPIHAGNGIPAGTPTVASLLKTAGYRTAHIGKWHLGYGQQYYPESFGFDHAEGYRYIAPGRQYDNVGQIPYLVDGSEDRSFGKSSSKSSDATTILADRAIEFIETDRARPFFLFLSFYRPHLRWLPVPEEDYAHYKDRPLSVADPSLASSVEKEQLQEWMRLYYANISCADRNIGRVLNALDDLALADDTVVIFIGDNGFMVGQHDLLGKGNARRLHVDSRGRISRDLGTRPNMFDDSILVPFILRWPGVINAGTISDALVSTIDVLPTVADIVGVEPPNDVDGRSLQPLIMGAPEVDWRKAYFDTYDMIYLGDKGEKPHMRMIRTHDWKLVLYHDETGQPLDNGGRHELFDLVRDRGELNNLYGRPSVQAIQQDLKARLHTWMRESGLTR